jgi:hypothetical protein
MVQYGMLNSSRSSLRNDAEGAVEENRCAKTFTKETCDFQEFLKFNIRPAKLKITNLLIVTKPTRVNLRFDCQREREYLEAQHHACGNENAVLPAKG